MVRTPGLLAIFEGIEKEGKNIKDCNGSLGSDYSSSSPIFPGGPSDLSMEKEIKFHLGDSNALIRKITPEGVKHSEDSQCVDLSGYRRKDVHPIETLDFWDCDNTSQNAIGEEHTEKEITRTNKHNVSDSHLNGSDINREECGTSSGPTKQLYPSPCWNKYSQASISADSAEDGRAVPSHTTLSSILDKPSRDLDLSRKSVVTQDTRGQDKVTAPKLDLYDKATKIVSDVLESNRLFETPHPDKIGSTLSAASTNYQQERSALRPSCVGYYGSNKNEDIVRITKQSIDASPRISTEAYNNASLKGVETTFADLRRSPSPAYKPCSMTSEPEGDKERAGGPHIFGKQQSSNDKTVSTKIENFIDSQGTKLKETDENSRFKKIEKLFNDEKKLLMEEIDFRFNNGDNRSVTDNIDDRIRQERLQKLQKLKYLLEIERDKTNKRKSSKENEKADTSKDTPMSSCDEENGMNDVTKVHTHLNASKGDTTTVKKAENQSKIRWIFEEVKSRELTGNIVAPLKRDDDVCLKHDEREKDDRVNGRVDGELNESKTEKYGNPKGSRTHRNVIRVPYRMKDIPGKHLPMGQNQTQENKPNEKNQHVSTSVKSRYRKVSGDNSGVIITNCGKQGNVDEEKKKRCGSIVEVYPIKNDVLKSTSDIYEGQNYECFDANASLIYDGKDSKLQCWKGSPDKTDEEAGSVNQISLWQTKKMCDMFNDDLWEMYVSVEDSDSCAERQEHARKDSVRLSSGKEDITEKEEYKGISAEEEINNMVFFRHHAANEGEKSRYSSRVDNPMCIQKGLEKKLEPLSPINRMASPDIAPSPTDNLRFFKNVAADPSFYKKPEELKRYIPHKPLKEIAATKSTQTPLNDKLKKSVHCDKDSKITGRARFFDAPLGSSEPLTGRRHSKESNFLFMKPPEQIDPENNNTSLQRKNEKVMADEKPRFSFIDADAAADNLIFFKSVAKSIHFFKKSSKVEECESGKSQTDDQHSN